MAYNDFRMDNQWLPFTPNRAYQKDPRVLVAAAGLPWGMKGMAISEPMVERRLWR